MTPLQIMILPFAECLVLVGIHSYLGLHVIRRKVIFVDLALAQIAALGTTVAFLFGLHPTGLGAYLFSLIFTIFAAAIFSVTRLKDERIPQEAVIGLTYALAAAIAILVIDRAPHGAEHIKEILTGTILWVKGSDVLTAAIVYSVVGLFHYIFRHKFLALAGDVAKVEAKGLNVKLWDFLFYVSFGLVISLSVRTAGVLLVFVFLVVPAMLAILITDKLLAQLLIGWGMGTIVSIGGMAISYYADFPAGPAVVAFYGLVLVVGALIVYVTKDPKHAFARLRYVLAGLGLVTLSGLGLYFMGKAMANSDFWKSGMHSHVSTVHEILSESKSEAIVTDPTSLEQQPVLNMAKVATSPDKNNEGAGTNLIDKATTLAKQMARLDIIDKEQKLAKVIDADLLQAIARAATDDETRLIAAKRLADLDQQRGIIELANFLQSPAPPLLRDQALAKVKAVVGSDFGYDSSQPPDSKINISAIHALKKKTGIIE